MTRIPIFDMRAQLGQLQGQILEALHRVLDSGRMILGNEVAGFEKEFTDYLNPAGHAISVANGTDALILAMKALSIGAGDEVITTPFTAVPTVSAIRAAGATPVLCDVEPHTGLLDIDQLPECLSERTKAVIPVHLFGSAVDIVKIRRVLAGANIAIIEDCAQALGSEIDSQLCGTLGDVSAFSFYPTKNLGACGDAGLVFSSDESIARKLRMLRMYGFDDQGIAQFDGINSRMDELQAAILRVKLPYLDEYLRRRRALAKAYDEHLDASVERLRTPANVNHSHHLYVIKVRRRQQFREQLEREGIQTGVHYPVPIHRMPAFEQLGAGGRQFPVSEALMSQVVSLPLYPELSIESVTEVCKVVNRVVQRAMGE